MVFNSQGAKAHRLPGQNQETRHTPAKVIPYSDHGKLYESFTRQTMIHFLVKLLRYTVYECSAGGPSIFNSWNCTGTVPEVINFIVCIANKLASILANHFSKLCMATC